MTTHAAVLIQDWNGPYFVYYAKQDGYPTSLGEKLIRELWRRQQDIEKHPWTTLDESIIQYLELEKAEITFPAHSREFHKVFTEQFTDLEWVYTIGNYAHIDSTGVSIFKTSNLVKCDPFIWKVWGRVIQYVDSSTLSALMSQVELVGDATQQMLIELQGVDV